jgi:hypothetical protein
MSKPRTPSPPRRPVTAASSAVEIMRAKVAAHLELIGRKVYQELLALQAEVAKLPPVPEDPGPSANEA